MYRPLYLLRTMSATAQIDQNREALSRMEDEGTVYVHEIWPEVKLWTKELCSFPSVYFVPDFEMRYPRRGATNIGGKAAQQVKELGGEG